MSYQETVNWMFRQLPMYQNQGKTAYKANLENTILLSGHLGHPEEKFKAIHVAGTNGKGSTSHMLASILQEAGYKVGLYTSPHLKDFRERIKINGKNISKKAVMDFIKGHRLFFETYKLSFFEMTVGLAFDYFAKEAVDVAIIEVGLGGRLDSTNIINPLVSVITNIGMDHTQFLGHSLAEIAYEKAGIIKIKTPVVIGETQPQTEDVFKLVANRLQSKIYFADQEDIKILESDLKGDYQKKNIVTVIQTICVIKSMGFHIKDAAIVSGLLKVVENTGLQGRWQIIQKRPKVICDTAHNREGLMYAMGQLQRERRGALHVVFGVVNDKDLDPVLPLLPKDATYYFCKPDIPRGLDARMLEALFIANGFEGKSYSGVTEAYKAAKKAASTTDTIYVGGSTFVVAEII